MSYIYQLAPAPKASKIYIALFTLCALVLSILVANTVMQPDDAPQTDYYTYLVTASSGKQMCFANVISVPPATNSAVIELRLSTGVAMFPADKFFVVSLGSMPLADGIDMCSILTKRNDEFLAEKTL